MHEHHVTSTGYVELLGKHPELRPTLRSVSRNRAPRRVCMISYSDYESDNRVLRYASSLAERGDCVDVLSVKRQSGQADNEVIGGVRVHRLQQRAGKNQRGKLGYLLPILRFWIRSSAWLTLNHPRAGFDLIHVHNVPDFLVYSAWLPKLSGTKVILDIHDIVPEFYASKFHLKPHSAGVKMLKHVERASAWFADHVILSNHLWFDAFVKRSAPEHKCSVFINHVNQSVFYPRQRTRNPSKPIILFPGGLQWHQGLDIAIDALPTVLRRVPGAEFHIYGDGNMKETLVKQSSHLGLSEKVRFFAPLPMARIAEVMSGADIGVVPKRADSFGNEAYSTKIMEFMSVGVPVVVSDTKIDRYYFDPSVVRFFESGNSKALAGAILEVLGSPHLRHDMVTRASDYAVRNSWEARKPDYLELVDSLCTNKD